MRPEFTQALGPAGVNALNAAARSGGASAVQQALQGIYDNQAAMSFADGGIIPYPGWLQKIAPDWMTNWVNSVNSNTGLNVVAGLITKSASKAWDALKAKYDAFAQSVTTDASVVDIQGDVAGYSSSDGQAKLAGGLGFSYQTIFNAVQKAFPTARLTSGLRNTPDAHGRGKAADIGGKYPSAFGSAEMAAIKAWLYTNYKGSLYELIYNGEGNRVPNLKNSADFPYSAATQAQHKNHVHAAVYDQGGVLKPGFTVAHNASGRPEAVLTAEQLEWLRQAAGNDRPLVDTINLQVVPGREKDSIEEMLFQLRKVKRGANV